MQSEKGASENIHAILDRFSTWAVTQSPNGKGHSLKVDREEVRELAYDEAIRRYGKWPQANSSTASRAEPAGQTAAPAAPASPPGPSKDSAPLKLEHPAIGDAVQAGSAVVRRAGKKSQPKVMKTAAKGTASAAGRTAELPRVPAGDQQGTTPAKKIASPPQASTTIDADKATTTVVALAETKPPAKASPTAAQRRKAGARSIPAEKLQMTVPAALNPAKPGAARPNGAKANALRKTAFREILARSVEAPPTPAQPTTERDTRISIRFTTSEEARVRKSAAQAGLTVSAWLRLRALETDPFARKNDGTAQNVPPGLTPPAPARPAVGLWVRLASWFTGARQRLA